MVEARRPDVALVDIRMPQGNAEAGLAGGAGDPSPSPRRRRVACSRIISTPATRPDCSRTTPNGSGSCSRSASRTWALLTDALHRIGEGECVVDPTIVARLVARKRERGPLEQLTEREQSVLALIAEGCSNGAIAQKLFLSRKTVETHVSQIFLKLRIRESADHHRRVLAVLAYLRSSFKKQTGPPGAARLTPLRLKPAG